MLEGFLLANLAIFAASSGVVWYAGTRIAGYADRIAETTGIGQAAIGVVLLGAVTSLPEIAVGTTASVSGHPALSVNDVLGSAAINVLILALADAALGKDALTSTPASTGALLQAVLSIILFVIVVAAVISGDVPVLGVGLSSWALLLAYIVALRLIVKSPGSRWVPADRGEAREAPAGAPETGKHESLRPLMLRTAAAATTILVSGFMLAQTGAAIAEQTGLGTSFVGAVLLGLATSLPEVSTVIGAVRLRRYEMAIGDIFGTNLFNVTIIVLVDAVYAGPPVLVEVGAFAAFAALLAMLLTAIFLAGMIERRDRTVLGMGFDSLAAIVCYAGGLAVLYHLR